MNELSSISSENLAETVAKIAQKPVTIASGTERGHLIAVPEGFSIHNDSALEKLQPAPYRKSGNIRFTTAESFAEFVNLHKTAETRLYAMVDHHSPKVPLRIISIFNEHQPEQATGSQAGWRDFRAEFIPLLAYEWATWNKSSREPFGQLDFAIFLEDNNKDIYSPDNNFPTGIQMLEMAKNLEINSDKKFKSAVRVQSGGTALTFIDQDDQATAERMDAFNRFSIGIPVFWKDQGYVLEARLRYRQKSGALALWYELVRPDLTVDDAVTKLLLKVHELTAVNPLFIQANTDV